METCAYIKDGFSCGKDTSRADPNLPYMCFRVTLAHSTTFIFALYCLHNSGVSIIESISEKIDHILSTHPSANIHVWLQCSQCWMASPLKQDKWWGEVLSWFPDYLWPNTNCSRTHSYAQLRQIICKSPWPFSYNLPRYVLILSWSLSCLN